jgi:hypothetical protein
LPDESGLVDGDTCRVEIVLSAWHIDEESGEGYSDEERIPLSFSLSIPASITTSFTTPLRTENEVRAPMSQSALVVDTEEEVLPQEVVTDEDGPSDSDDNSIADTEDQAGEIKPADGAEEGIQTEDTDTEEASGEEGGEETEVEATEDGVVVEDAENSEETEVEDSTETVAEITEGESTEDSEVAVEAGEETAE